MMRKMARRAQLRRRLRESPGFRPASSRIYGRYREPRVKHMGRTLFGLALIALVARNMPAQVGAQVGPHSAPQRGLSGEVEIRQALERLNTLGSVMMIGAHPDDEREVVLAYLALGRHLRTAYLSLNRGEGGQNLVGPEQGDELGIIRTQELQA